MWMWCRALLVRFLFGRLGFVGFGFWRLTSRYRAHCVQFQSNTYRESLGCWIFTANYIVNLALFCCLFSHSFVRWMALPAHRPIVGWHRQNDRTLCTEHHGTEWVKTARIGRFSCVFARAVATSMRGTSFSFVWQTQDNGCHPNKLLKSTAFSHHYHSLHSLHYSDLLATSYRWIERPTNYYYRNYAVYRFSMESSLCLLSIHVVVVVVLVVVDVVDVRISPLRKCISIIILICDNNERTAGPTHRPLSVRPVGSSLMMMSKLVCNGSRGYSLHYLCAGA